MEPLDRLEARLKDNIKSMAEALADGVCMNREDPARAYAICVGRVEAWKSVLEDIRELRAEHLAEE